jgi:DNA-binding GntR family transcriptional regulator
MLYAASKDALRRALVGVAVEIQGTDFSEVAYENGAFHFSIYTLSPTHSLWLLLSLAIICELNLSPVLVLDKANRGH